MNQERMPSEYNYSQNFNWLKKQKAGKAAFKQTVIILYFRAQFN